MKYDVLVIGAGMSGLGAAIRLAMFDKKVCLIESHRIPGGLNSYYQRKKFEFDVGLHALTNYVPKKTKGPMTKMLKQLRIPYDSLELIPQNYSVIDFPDAKLKFSNDFELLLSEVATSFPAEIDGFRALAEKVKTFDEVNLQNEYLPAKEVVKHFIKNPMLLEMIFSPIMIYGSAWEHDMDFSQFAIMFKSLYFEGFSRPRGGVRTILDQLTKRAEEVGVEFLYKTEITSLKTEQGKILGVITSKGDLIEANQVYSSMGHPETIRLVDQSLPLPRIGKMSFMESIALLEKRPKEWGEEATIIFWNQTEKYHYRCPDSLWDPGSAVVCLPNNYQEDDLNEGVVRVTNMANFDYWNDLDRPQYNAEKEKVFKGAMGIVSKISPGFKNDNFLYRDIFSPTTVKRYTSHLRGCVYGSPDKLRDGQTSIEGLHLIGTDQGFLGIIGSLLSGISMVNLHTFSKESL